MSLLSKECATVFARIIENLLVIFNTVELKSHGCQVQHVVQGKTRWAGNFRMRNQSSRDKPLSFDFSNANCLTNLHFAKLLVKNIEKEEIKMMMYSILQFANKLFLL